MALQMGNWGCFNRKSGVILETYFTLLIEVKYIIPFIPGLAGAHHVEISVNTSTSVSFQKMSLEKIGKTPGPSFQVHVSLLTLISQLL